MAIGCTLDETGLGELGQKGGADIREAAPTCPLDVGPWVQSPKGPARDHEHESDVLCVSIVSFGYEGHRDLPCTINRPAIHTPF